MSSHVWAPSAPERDVEAAFAQVLQAEQAARAAVDEARAQAAQVAERSRGEVRARAERTRSRIATVRAAFEAALQAGLQGLAADADALAAVTPLVTNDHDRIEQAVQRVARQLTGGEP
ncbi:MAG: hypothetical protein OEU94_10280 [Aquincola sp.]|nr:hypothetical protein [Aquincola sp.]MDH4289625.1 hypothetical protein [Aquincola sp.]MDH5329296.1 hypothetical protein [Aquincola sp.]